MCHIQNLASYLEGQGHINFVQIVCLFKSAVHVLLLTVLYEFKNNLRQIYPPPRSCYAENLAL